MPKLHEAQAHLQDVATQYELRAQKGTESINDMIHNLSTQVEFAEMVQHMGQNALGGQDVIQTSAEEYSHRLPKLKEQLMYAIRRREQFAI